VSYPIGGSVGTSIKRLTVCEKKLSAVTPKFESLFCGESQVLSTEFGKAIEKPNEVSSNLRVNVGSPKTATAETVTGVSNIPPS
jgi:hypothetical protein